MSDKSDSEASDDTTVVGSTRSPPTPEQVRHSLGASPAGSRSLPRAGACHFSRTPWHASRQRRASPGDAPARRSLRRLRAAPARRHASGVMHPGCRRDALGAMARASRPWRVHTRCGRVGCGGDVRGMRGVAGRVGARRVLHRLPSRRRSKRRQTKSSKRTISTRPSSSIRKQSSTITRTTSSLQTVPFAI